MTVRHPVVPATKQGLRTVQRARSGDNDGDSDRAPSGTTGREAPREWQESPAKAATRWRGAEGADVPRGEEGTPSQPAQSRTPGREAHLTGRADGLDDTVLEALGHTVLWALALPVGAAEDGDLGERPLLQDGEMAS